MCLCFIAIRRTHYTSTALMIVNIERVLLFFRILNIFLRFIRAQIDIHRSGTLIPALTQALHIHEKDKLYSTEAHTHRQHIMVQRTDRKNKQAKRMEQKKRYG